MLQVTKRIINGAVKALSSMIPDKPARTPDAKIVEKVFHDLERHAEYEMKRNRAYNDGNFLKLLKTARKTLVLLMDEDPVYRQWTKYAMVKLTETIKSGVD